MNEWVVSGMLGRTKRDSMMFGECGSKDVLQERDGLSGVLYGACVWLLNVVDVAEDMSMVSWLAMALLLLGVAACMNMQ